VGDAQISVVLNY